MKIHFIGIGGIGLSALAKYLKNKNYIITGSDIKETVITKNLKKLNIDIQIPHNSKIIDNQDLVIYSAVIKNDNTEIIEAKKQNIKTISRKESLKFILKDEKVYSVCGAHGKSTTSSILASIIPNSSAIIGAETKEFKSNMRYFNNDLIVFEADESDASYLNSNPYCAILTNTEPEHMEYYNYDYDLFYNCYRKFLESAKIKVINCEDKFLNDLNIDAIRLYPKKDIKNIEYILIDDEPYTKFELKDFGFFEVWGFGEHIAIDTSLAILASLNESTIENIRKNLKNFKGIKKRFDFIYKSENQVIIDDYAHHPTEIEVTLNSVKEYIKLKNLNTINVIWQPHKYSRTIDNLKHFKSCFQGCDKLIILPVWSAGEKKIDIDFKNEFKDYNLLIIDKIIREGSDIKLIKNDKVIDVLNKDLIIGFGAGDITYQLRVSSR